MSRANFLPTGTYSCIMCSCESNQKFTFEHLSNKHNIYFYIQFNALFVLSSPVFFATNYQKPLYPTSFYFYLSKIANKTTNHLQLVDISTSQVVYYIIDKTSTYAEKQKYGE